MTKQKLGIVVFGHGSSVESANDAVRAMAQAAAERGQWDLYETAFLDFDPKLRYAVEKLVERGATEILVAPYFLTLGIHLKRDLPKLADEIARETAVPIRIAPPLDGHPELGRILADRVREMLS